MGFRDTLIFFSTSIVDDVEVFAVIEWKPFLHNWIALTFRYIQEQ